MKKKLNQEQLQAIQHGQGPLLIIAGAGTGKTTVITERIKYLISQELAKPAEILALTFTEKAALEMETRVDEIMPYGYTQMWIVTFHSFCDRILRREAMQIGLDPKYVLMTEAETVQFLKQHLFKLKLDYFRPRGDPNKFLPGLLSHFNRLRDENITPSQYLDWVKSEKEEVEKNLELAQAFKTYQQLKEQAGRMDFADLISYSLHLLQTRQSVRRQYQQQFKYILVDEFQDTNIAQNELVILLAGKAANLTCVSDDDQSIYRFRGAAVSNVLQFKQTYPQAETVTLVKNYRSTQEILDRAYDLIQHNNPDRLEVKEAIDKKLVAVRQLQGEKIEFIFTDRVEDEADRVVKEIKKLTQLRQGSAGQAKNSQALYDYRDFAILVRANNHAEPFIRALQRQAIPWQFLGPGQLLRQEEVKNLIAYLRLLNNFEDDVAFYKLITMAVFEFEPRDLAVLRNFARKQNLSLFEAAEKNEKFNHLVAMIQGHLGQLAKQTAGEILFDFIQKSGWYRFLLDPPSIKKEQQVQNLAKFFDKLKAYEASPPVGREDASVFAVNDWLNLKLELGESPLVTESDWQEINAVNLLTVHSAKGLEFPVVFLVNLVNERFPTRNRREAIPIPGDLIKEILPAGDSHEQEERRLFYVGLTRAQDRVYLTASQFYGEAKRAKKISPFVFEVLGRKFKPEKLELGDQLAIFDFAPVKEQELPISDYRLPITYLSYSQIETFKNCPLQYKYRHILKLPAARSHSQSFGTSIHNAMRDWYQQFKSGQKLSWRQVLKLLKQNWISEGYDSKVHEKKAYGQAKEFLQGYFHQSFDSKSKIIGLEDGFNVKLAADLWLKGRIDRVESKRGGGIEIIDYKTGRLMEQKQVDQSLQMTIYGLAATDPGIYNCRPEKATFSFYFFDGQKKLSTKRTKSQLTQAKKDILAIRKQIQKSDFTPKPGYLCQFCDYRLLCPAV